MSRFIDMTNKKFNGCLVVEYAGSNYDNKATWKCKCDCGKVFIATGKHIRNGSTKSCGCLKIKTIKEVGIANITHGETKTRLYNIWRGMKKRCTTPNDTSYKNYGEKGIEVCKEWLGSYEAFRDWALSNGYNDLLTIDRMDNSGNYEPKNCRWADWKTQERNKSNNVRVLLDGKEMTLSQLAEELGESRAMIWYRYHNGISFDKPKKNIGGYYGTAKL